MILPIYQIDAFTNQIFQGNPAAVIPLSEWISEDLMQKIAQENNLAETSFFVPVENGFHIRWFTPSVEIDLCGHATIAAAYVLFNVLGLDSNEIIFDSLSGPLKVTKNENWLTLDFPVDVYQVAVPPPALVESMKSATFLEVLKGRSDYMVVLGSEAEVQNLDLDIIALSTIPTRGVIVTAKGDDLDFVSRFFAPQSGIDEDPVTGSTHTTLTPYWADKLHKTALSAKQISKRGGYLNCELIGDRVKISGEARLYLTGEIEI